MFYHFDGKGNLLSFGEYPTVYLPNPTNSRQKVLPNLLLPIVAGLKKRVHGCDDMDMLKVWLS